MYLCYYEQTLWSQDVLTSVARKSLLSSIAFSCSSLKGVTASQMILIVSFLQRKEQLKNTHIFEN